MRKLQTSRMGVKIGSSQVMCLDSRSHLLNSMVRWTTGMLLARSYLYEFRRLNDTGQVRINLSASPKRVKTGRGSRLPPACLRR
ncbi:protein of unknown function [Nitrospira japonica]|uniref:Uncharacterized protein n=1 Tax=Nitrospira japonica TaxID=1325564 RepID=A0A1W1I5W8_9BACT|nr:protein of unknown function [Nitrospira japonica]